jgi:hypothetical protein
VGVALGDRGRIKDMLHHRLGRMGLSSRAVIASGQGGEDITCSGGNKDFLFQAGTTVNDYHEWSSGS